MPGHLAVPFFLYRELLEQVGGAGEGSSTFTVFAEGVVAGFVQLLLLWTIIFWLPGSKVAPERCCTPALNFKGVL